MMMTARSDAAAFVQQYLSGGASDSWQPYLPRTDFELQPASLPAAHELTGMDHVREQYGLTGEGQTVAIIDGGIAYDHWALGGGYGNGYRVVGGWDFTEGSVYTGEWNPYEDAGGHGTHVAGIVGSSDPNNLGVAPDVDLVALRVFGDNGGGSFSAVEKSLRWIYEHRNDFRNPITTVNLSLGAGYNSDRPPSWAMLEDEFLALKQVGIFISVAAGNDFQEFYTPGLDYPAASPYVVPAMSTDTSGAMSYFSQRLDRAIAAPGQGIRSTVPDHAGNNNGQADDFAYMSGTSMAAPYLAGAAVIVREALEMAGRTNINQDMIYQIIRDTADKFFDAATNAYYQRLNIERAVDSVLAEDLEGYSRSTCSNVGSFGLRKTAQGSIDFEGDRDFLRFTATRSGSVTLCIDGQEGSQFQLRRYYADGSSRYVNGNTITFEVKAGKTYDVCIRALEGTGDYSASFRLTPSFRDLGEVSETVLRGEKISGERWYCVNATQDGALRAESWIDRNTNDVRLEIYDQDFRRIDLSDGRYKDNVQGGAECGETFFVRLAGNNSDVKLRLRSVATS